MSDSDDRRAFAEAMRGVKPLEREARAERTRRPPPRARQRRAADLETLASSVAAHGADVAAHDTSFRRAGISERTLRELGRGRFRVQAELDLHGMTRAEAREALKAFVADARDAGLGCVRVIHGKGRRSGPDGPVLKASVQTWLTQWEDVLAFAPARAEHGGSGALLVLLRR
ncbi:MAG TPA: Smr/MutS family protein [Gammaproteobacteria bacterium]